jgi:TonB-linked SusC/RagA family outer membrane protein
MQVLQLNKKFPLATVVILLLIKTAAASPNIGRELTDSHAIANLNEIKVHGTITDAKGSSLAGVTVMIKGTVRGTISDMNGNYSLTVNAPATLVYTFVGFKTQEIYISDQKTANVKMIEESNSLDAVVVVGYGTQSKRNIAGSVSSVKMGQTRDLPNTNITEDLRGRVAGVQFTSDGRPGQTGAILVRGARSLSGGNNPLIVVDGTFFNGSLGDINPSDIESIDVLKDASAAAIYGSRAANGVILITSKKGNTDKPAVQLNAYSGISRPSREIKLLSPQRYLEKTIDYLRESGQTVKPNPADNLTSSEGANYNAGKTIDPWKAATQKALINSIDLSISGKSGKTAYFNSASFTNEKGILFNDNQKHITVRSNMESQVADWLKIGMTSTISNRDLSGNTVDLNSLYYSSPYGTWYYPDGQPTQFTVPSETISGNPVYNALLTRNSQVSRNLFANFYGILNVPGIPGLSYRLNYSPNYRWDHNYNATMQDTHISANTKSASKINAESFDYVVENILTYNKEIGDHYFDVTLLYGRNRNRFESTTATASQLSTDALGWNSLTYGGTQTVASTASEVDGISTMARINYRFKQRYLFTMTARRDGSSVFAKNNKYATFPSASIAWIASDESFLKNAKAISLLKFRASYGAVGNQAINPYQSISLSSTNNYVYGNPGTTALGVFPANMANDNLKWETTYTANFGIDFGLLHNRISGSIEYYNSNTRDLLVKRIIPVMTGYSSVYANLGETNNKGFDFTLNTENIKTSKFSWSSNFTMSTNSNKIVHLYRSDANKDGKEDDDIANKWFIGHPITSYYDYAFNGIYQAGDDIPASSQPGFVKLKDVNGDGKIDANDKSIVATGGTPKFMGGVGNTFTYGNFSLNVFVNFMLGWKTDFILLDPNSTISENSPGRALNQIDAGWWTPENKSNTRPSLVYTNPYGMNWYVSRNFLRIQDATLSYRLPDKLVQRLHMTNLRIYGSGKNLYTFTKYPGSDPEVNAGGTAANIKANMYPLARIITFGVSAGF